MEVYSCGLVSVEQAPDIYKKEARRERERKKKRERERQLTHRTEHLRKMTRRGQQNTPKNTS